MDIKDSKFLPPDQVMDGQNLSMDVFYNKTADTTIRLKDGQILKFNKAALISIVKSRVLYHIFFGDLTVEETKIDDIDYETFKLFLDCVMGYKKLNFENAFKVFPVFHKYQVEHLMSECIDCLIPSVMNEKVCDVLNVAAYYACDELIQKLIKFLALNNIPQFLENEKYFQPLQPDAWKIILNNLKIDSGLLLILAKWGMNYIEENSLLFETSRQFFEKHDLLKFFKLEYFETTGAISEFFLSEAGKDILTLEGVVSHLHNSKDLLHRKSKWINVKKNDTILERISVSNIQNGKKFVLHVKVKRNQAIFYHEQLPEEGKQKEDLENKIFCEIKFKGAKMDRCENTCKFSDWNLEFRMTDDCMLSRSTNYYFYTNAHFDITWKFLQKSRVLLTTQEGDKSNNGKMYFTRDILACFKDETSIILQNGQKSEKFTC